MKVLAFEDSVDIEALLISGGIDLSGFEFKQYWDSQNYLGRIAELSPDILMLDHYMPPTRGLEDPTAAEEDENYYTDDDGVEWWKDDDGYWWYREPGQEDWQPHD